MVKCVKNECVQIANYNFGNKKMGKYCPTHKKESMIIVTKEKCIHNNCNKTPNFNFKGEMKGIYCACFHMVLFQLPYL